MTSISEKKTISLALTILNKIIVYSNDDNNNKLPSSLSREWVGDGKMEKLENRFCRSVPPIIN